MYPLIAPPTNLVFLFVGIPTAYVFLQIGLSYVPLYFSMLRLHRIRDRWASIVKAAGLGSEISILDVGCGTGTVSIGLAHQLPQAHVTGIDIFQGMSGHSALQPTLNAQLENVADRVSFRQGNLLNIPFPEKSFDLVTAGSVLHEVHGDKLRLQALREIMRVLKPGGKFISVEMLKDRRMKLFLLLFSRVWESKNYWRLLHEQGGFENQRAEEYAGFLTLGIFTCEKSSIIE